MLPKLLWSWLGIDGRYLWRETKNFFDNDMARINENFTLTSSNGNPLTYETLLKQRNKNVVNFKMGRNWRGMYLTVNLLLPSSKSTMIVLTLFASRLKVPPSLFWLRWSIFRCRADSNSCATKLNALGKREHFKVSLHQCDQPQITIFAPHVTQGVIAYMLFLYCFFV